jgi:hypothetical protein
MREVTSKDGLGAGIVGLGVMYMVYPYAASELAPDASFGTLSIAPAKTGMILGSKALNP